MASLTQWTWGEWTPGVCDGQAGLACCNSWGRKELDMTEWLNWTELNWTEFALIHGPNIPGSYAILLFTALDIAYITSHIQNWVIFFFFFSLAPSLHSLWSYFSTYLRSINWHLPTWGVHISVSYPFAFSYCSWGSQGIILKWFDIPFSSGPHFVRTLHHDLSVLGGHTWHGS